MSHRGPIAAKGEPLNDLSDDDFIDAVGILESQLKGEDWFLEQVRSRIRHHTGLEPDAQIPSHEFKTMMTTAGHDYVIHIAQFYFFLRALKCETVQQIDALMKNHNDKFEERIKKGTEAYREEQLKTAMFKPKRKGDIRDTFEFYGRPVFAISELASFLFDTMAPTKTTSLIKELLKGGVFKNLSEDQSIDAPFLTDPRRILVEPAPGFVESYAQSLLMMRPDSKMAAE